MSKKTTTPTPAAAEPLPAAVEEQLVPATDASDADQVIPVTEEPEDEFAGLRKRLDSGPPYDSATTDRELSYEEIVNVLNRAVVVPAPLGAGRIVEHGISPVAQLSATYATDEPDPATGGSCHLYKTLVVDAEGKIAHSAAVKFHKGALSTVGGVPNGIADSTLLSILVHRWELFQAGPFASAETGLALAHVKTALEVLNDRTRERTERGVQGEHKE